MFHSGSIIWLLYSASSITENYLFWLQTCHFIKGSLQSRWHWKAVSPFSGLETKCHGLQNLEVSSPIWPTPPVRPNFWYQCGNNHRVTTTSKARKQGHLTLYNFSRNKSLTITLLSQKPSLSKNPLLKNHLILFKIWYFQTQELVQSRYQS